MDYSDGINNQRKGVIGEYIVAKVLIKKGFYIYTPLMEGTHEFDMVVVKRKSRKEQIYKDFYADVKTTSSTDFNNFKVSKRQFDKYIKLTRQLRTKFYIFFVNIVSKKIYYGDINKMNKNKKRNKGVYLIPLSCLNFLDDF